MLDQSPQLPDEDRSQRLDSPSGVYFVAIGPLRLKPPVSHTAVYLDQILAPAEQAARLTDRPVHQGERRCLVTEDLIQLSQIVKAHLRLRKFFQLPGGRFLGAEIPEQAVADASIRHSPQLLLYRLQRLPRPSRTAHLQQHREDCGKPSDGS